MAVRVVIVGAGGHGQVVADILLRAAGDHGPLQPIGFVDDNPELKGVAFLQLPVLGSIADLEAIEHDALVVAIGDNALRRRLFLRFETSGARLATAVHPSAVIAPDVIVAAGAMICAGVVINTGSSIGPNTIVNTGATVDHHNRIGAHCHIAPGVHLGGEVAVGENTLVGIGSTVLPRVEIGRDCTVAAGAVVNRSVPACSVVAGLPARTVGRNEP